MIRKVSAQPSAMAYELRLARSRFVGVTCPVAEIRPTGIAAGAGVRRSHEGGPPRDRRP